MAAAAAAGKTKARSRESLWWEVEESRLEESESTRQTRNPWTEIDRP